MAKRKQPYRFGVPAKYLEGLSDDAARKRAAEINGKLFPGLENMTKEAIENIINFPKLIDNSKAKKELKLKISPLEKTIKDTIYE